jgi:uncharacterized C2H2 Zn-finger protein
MHRHRSFWLGRNGPDALSGACSLLACVLLVAAMFLPGAAGSLLWLLALGCLVVSYYRMLSRNLPKRQAENQRFLDRIAPVTQWRNRRKTRRRQKNLYCFFKCPQCGTVLRVPKGKGHIRITCKTCAHVFERNS